jgi:hypothetical protein
MSPKAIKSGATFSLCQTWRYKLWRRWSPAGPTIAFIGLNPSTADEVNDDPTVRRCIGFARRWGFGGMYMLNVFAYRSTNPRALTTAADPVGPRNDATLARICRRCDMVVACWGTWGRLFDRGQAAIELLGDMPVHCLGTTRGGHPKHPLYLRLTTLPLRFPRGGDAGVERITGQPQARTADRQRGAAISRMPSRQGICP